MMNVRAIHSRRRFLLGLGAAVASALVPFPLPASAQTRGHPELKDFTPLCLRAGKFTLSAWIREGRGDTLRVFIAGDGPAWASDGLASSNPTPRHSVSALLAADMPRTDPVLYLARPGQYAPQEELRRLSPVWWTSHRYAAEVVQAVSIAVREAQQRCSASKVALYGFSGGGALAVLAAPALLPDLTCLGTIASPLDTALWTRLLGSKALPHSLNPKTVAAQLFSVPQIHLAGGRDTVVPPQVLDSWLSELQPLPEWIRRVIVPEAEHQGPWLQTWRVEHAVFVSLWLF